MDRCLYCSFDRKLFENIKLKHFPWCLSVLVRANFYRISLYMTELLFEIYVWVLDAWIFGAFVSNNSVNSQFLMLLSGRFSIYSNGLIYDIWRDAWHDFVTQLFEISYSNVTFILNEVKVMRNIEHFVMETHYLWPFWAFDINDSSLNWKNKASASARD